LAARFLRKSSDARRVLRVGMIGGAYKLALLAGAHLLAMPSEHEFWHSRSRSIGRGHVALADSLAHSNGRERKAEGTRQWVRGNYAWSRIITTQLYREYEWVVERNEFRSTRERAACLGERR
jgi:hypothetical protein